MTLTTNVSARSLHVFVSLCKKSSGSWNIVMALSWALRSASSTIRGYSNLALVQPAARFSCISNAPKIAMLQSRQTGSDRFNNILQNQITPLRADYRSAATSAGSHSTLWVAERALSVALIGITPIAIAMPCKPLDVLLAVSMVAHTYWGFEAIIQDYVRELLFGSVVPKAAHLLLVAIMVATLGGLFYLIFNDIGLAATIRKLWGIKPRE